MDKEREGARAWASESRRAEALFAAQNQVLERIAAGCKLTEILNDIARNMELEAPEAWCSILLLDDSGQQLRLGAAPSLPAAFNEAVDRGIPVAPESGSCGTAAYRRETVVVTDIATDPLWELGREQALPHGLRACRSSPVLSSQGVVLATFALYYAEARGPTKEEQQAVERWMHLTGLAVERERTERRLRERAEEMQTLLETLPIGVLIAHDAEAIKITGNDAARLNLRVPTGGNLSLSAPVIDRAARYKVYRRGQLLPPEELPVQRAARGERVRDEELEIVFEDGTLQHELVSAAPLLDANGRPRGAVAALLNITDRKRAEQALNAEKERAQVTLASIGDGVIRADARGRVEYLNAVAELFTGWDQTEANGKPLTEVFKLVDESGRDTSFDPIALALSGRRAIQLPDHAVLVGRHGTHYAIEDSVAPIRDHKGQVIGVVLVFRDVTEQRRLATQLSYQATHDMLTGLVNRHEFEHRLDRVIETARNGNGEHALCYLDLDQFKVVNDTCGHVAGDELLRQLASLFFHRVRQRDTLARLGGDEFGLLLEHCSLAKALDIAEGLRESVDQFRFVWEDKSFRVGVSMGLVPIDATVGSKSNVLRAADGACYVAKEAGRNKIHVYAHQDVDLARRRGQMQWISRIQLALDQNRFQLFAQRIEPLEPELDAGVHCELLLRLLDDGGELVLPGVFMPVAERYHLASRIDQWVVATAFRWLADHPSHLQRIELCAINLSGQSLGDRALQSEVLGLLHELELPAGKICFEITETAAIANLAAATRFIKELRGHGCRFALDDFGSGLSSFAYLRSLPVEFLKIDGVFVKDIVHDPIDLALVRSINDIGQLMGKRTIAEHVEHADLLERIRSVGVDFVQGFGVARPRPLADLLADD